VRWRAQIDQAIGLWVWTRGRKSEGKKDVTAKERERVGNKWAKKRKYNQAAAAPGPN
jgi:hypothetical protein